MIIKKCTVYQCDRCKKFNIYIPKFGFVWYGENIPNAISEEDDCDFVSVAGLGNNAALCIDCAEKFKELKNKFLEGVDF